MTQRAPRYRSATLGFVVQCRCLAGLEAKQSDEARSRDRNLSTWAGKCYTHHKALRRWTLPVRECAIGFASA